jgi:alpha-mannosidase
MKDDAHMGMIDQTTLGHRFLLNELGVVPTVGWQLDPFGHSATQASLLTSRAGFDALYFGRIDYQDLALRQETSECEGVWEASSNLEHSEIFWGLTGSYQELRCPGRLCLTFCNDEPWSGERDA